MRTRSRTFTYRAAQVALALTLACGGSTGGGSDVSIDSLSVPPTATVGVAAAVSGTASSVNGNPLTFAWSIAPASCGGFDNAALASTTFTAAQAGTCTVSLIVTAGNQSASDSAQVVVSAATDQPPVIDTFTVPGSATNGTAVNVSVTAHDPNGDAITYAWSATPSGCGTFGNAAAAATTFTGTQNGTCTVRMTVTAKGLTGSRSQGVVVSTPCTGAGCGGTLQAVDPLPQPPNGINIQGEDTGARHNLWKDQNPAGSGDLFGVFRAGAWQAGSSGTYYLLVSTNGGASWSYLTIGGTAPTSANGTTLHEQTLCQDTVAGSYKVHYVTWPDGAATSLYHRLALTYTGGHISGASWEASDVPGPAFNAAGSTYPQGAAKVMIQEVVDGSGNHVLVLAGMDRPSATRLVRLVASRTAAGANPLAPTATTSWRKLTDATAAGYDVLLAKNTDTGVDSAAWLNLTNVPNSGGGAGASEHESDFTFAQLGSNASLHFFFGPYYYNDANAYGDIRRWRLTASGVNWVNDAAVNGAVVAPAASFNKPCLGNSKGTASYAWVTWGDGAGIHIGRVDASGAWLKDAVPQPDTSAATSNWWFSAINVAGDGAQIWAYWERISLASGVAWTDTRRYYSGGAWGTATNDTAYFNTPSSSAYGSATEWSPIGGMPAGIGVMVYGDTDWNGATQHYHLHVVQ
jgi:hypothetical protein